MCLDVDREKSAEYNRQKGTVTVYKVALKGNIIVTPHRQHPIVLNEAIVADSGLLNDLKSNNLDFILTQIDSGAIHCFDDLNVARDYASKIVNKKHVNYDTVKPIVIRCKAEMDNFIAKGKCYLSVGDYVFDSRVIFDNYSVAFTQILPLEILNV